MNSGMSLKVLVDYEELQRLRKFSQEHRNCDSLVKKDNSSSQFHSKKNAEDHNQISSKEGRGLDCDGDNSRDNAAEVCLRSNLDTSKDFDQRAPNIEPKETIVEKEPSVTETSTKTLKDTDVINGVWKKFQPHAKSLMEGLRSHSDKISYDKNGVVTIKGTLLEGSILLEIK